jgi:ribosome-associated toxin RatA of RatAB toxin-antitoxin module
MRTPKLAASLALAALLSGLAAVPGTVGSAAAQQVEVTAANHGGLVTVTASARLQVEPRTVWAVISDYDHLASFIPFMRSSKVVQRDGDRLLVDQAGEFVFLFFRQPVDVRLEVIETPEQRIVARAVSGNLRTMEGRYLVEPLPTGEVRLSYTGGLTPEFPVPPLVGTVVVRMVLARQFQALVAEILRRDAAARAAPAR